MLTRRTFNRNLALAATGTAISATAKSYAQIAGANERVNFAVCGINSRGGAHIAAIGNNKATASPTCATLTNAFSPASPHPPPRSSATRP